MAESGNDRVGRWPNVDGEHGHGDIKSPGHVTPEKSEDEPKDMARSDSTVAYQ